MDHLTFLDNSQKKFDSGKKAGRMVTHIFYSKTTLKIMYIARLDTQDQPRREQLFRLSLGLISWI